MATETEKLVVALEAKIAQFERNFQRASRTADTNFNRMERRAAQFKKNMSAAMGGIGGAGSLIGPVAGAVSLKGAQEFIDASTRIRNSLKVAGLEGQQLDSVYQQLFASAQANAAPIETLVGLYSRLSLVQGELGVNGQQLIGFTNTIAQALRASSTDAQAASGALMQLGQALGGGKVQAEEWGSIVDGLPALVRAAAVGIEEAGGSVSKLTQLVKAGEVSSKAFFDGIGAGAHVLESQLAGSVMTVGQGFTRLANTLTDVAGEFNDNADAAHVLNQFLDELGGLIREVGNNAALIGGPLQQMAGWLNGVSNAANDAGAKLHKLLGFDKLKAGVNDALFGDGTSQAAVQSRIDGAFGPLTTPTTGRMPQATKAPAPISLKNYAVPASGSGGGGKSRAPKTDDFAREIQQAERRIALLRLETEGQRGINPLIEDYGRAAETASMKAQLLAAAQEAGKTVTPELSAQIDKLAAQYGEASAEAQKLADDQDKLKDNAREFGEFGGSLVSGFVSDLRAGKSATEALANGLNKIVDRLIEMAIQAAVVRPLMNSFGGLGSIFGGASAFPSAPIGLFATGGHVSGPGTSTSDSIPARLSDGEFVVNAAATRRNRALLEAINSGKVPSFRDGGAVGRPLAARVMEAASAGNSTFAPVTNISVQGASGDPAQQEQLAKSISRQVDQMMEEKMSAFVAKQQRGNGMMNRRFT